MRKAQKFLALLIFFTLIFFDRRLDAIEIFEDCDLPLMSVDADQADYNENKISLTGNVVIVHDLGKICAEQMTLSSLSNKKKKSFGLIEMRDQVLISFRGAGELRCSHADIDYDQRKGSFIGDSKAEFVVYKDVYQTKKSEATPLVVKSRRMNIKLNDDSFDKNERKQVVKEITAEDNVTISYDNNFIVTADYANFKSDSTKSKSPTFAPGLISLHGFDPNSFCQVSNRQGEYIKSKKILIDTVKQCLLFSQPRGVLSTVSHSNKFGQIDFSADELLWDEVTGILTLKDNVKVNQVGIGKMQTAKEMRLYHAAENGQRSLQRIETDVDTVLTYVDEIKAFSHILTCHGPIRVDHQKLETKFFSPKNSAGKIDEEQQVFFQDLKGEIFADRALVSYQYCGGTLIPIKIVLIGNIRIYNRLSASEDETQIVLQYILADRVDFTPRSKEMVFQAVPGKRVLFYDKTNNLEVSAPALKIIRDQATKKESIQGIGDVRFSFIEHEFEQLRRKFFLEKQSEESETEILRAPA